jgi:hypothetical protein
VCVVGWTGIRVVNRVYDALRRGATKCAFSGYFDRSRALNAREIYKLESA